MNNATPLSLAFFATLISALIIFLTRFFPFALFGKKEPPAIVHFIEQFIPSLMMGILLAYSLKDVTFTQHPFGIPHGIALAVTVILHLAFKNSLISIFGGTGLFMLLSHLLTS